MLLIIFLPFLQLGFSYYLSVQSLLLIYISFYYKVSSKYYLIGIVFFIIFFLKFLYEPLLQDDLLRTFREFFCFVLIIISTYGFRKVNLDVSIKLLKIFLILFVSFICIQQISIIFFHLLPAIPSDLFIMNTGTLKGIDLALEAQTRIRPIGFYGEPSYASFILVIIYYLINQASNDKSKSFEFLTIIGIFLLQSFAGLIMLSYLLVLKHKKYIFRKKNIFPILVSLYLIIYLFLRSEMSVRLFAVLDGNADLSTQIRFLYPFLTLINSLSDFNFFGISTTHFYAYNPSGGDNGILNIFTTYGILSIVIYAFLYYRIKNIALFILFLLLNQTNGDVFSFDKVIMYSLLFGLNHEINRTNMRWSKT